MIGRCYDCDKFSWRLTERRSCSTCARSDGLDGWGRLHCWNCDAAGGLPTVGSADADVQCTTCGDPFFSSARRMIMGGVAD